MNARPMVAAAFLAAVPYALLHPFLPEFVLAQPWMALGLTLALLSSCNLLWMRWATDAVSIGGLVVGLALAPLAAWPLALTPLLRRDLSGRRWGLTAGLVAVLTLATVTGVAFREGAAALEDEGAAKLTEAVRLMPAILGAAAAPWETPILGTARTGNPLPGLILVFAVLGALAVLIVSESRSRLRDLLWLSTATFFAPFLTALFGRPHPGLAWPFLLLSALLLIEVAQQVGSLLVKAPETARLAPLLTVSCLLLGLALPAVRLSVSRWETWSSEDSAWQALLDEKPLSPYRWNYAEELRAGGDERGFLNQALTYLRSNGTDRPRQLQVALWYLDKGNDAAALHHLRKAGDAVDSPTEEGQAALLGLYERTGEWESYLRVAKSVPKSRDDLHFQIARAAYRSDKVELGDTHLRCALEAEKPSLEAIFLGYRRFLRNQDIEALECLGRRTQDLYPESALGFAICGKAAKITRQDDEVISWYEQALEKDPDQADLHFDLGLIHHGREGQQEKAAQHYARVLELHPGHPRRNVLRNWISSLRAEASEETADGARK